MATLDILIPCYRPTEKLNRCIASINAHTHFPFNLLISAQKCSVAENRNHLLQMSRSPYIAFLDDDVEVPQDWDLRLIECLESIQLPETVTIMGVTVHKPFIGVVGPRILGADRLPQNPAGRIPEGQFAVEYVCGAVMLWKRTTWPTLFADTNYIKSQFEDTDLVMQMIAKRGVPVVDGRVAVIHNNEKTDMTSHAYTSNRAYFHAKWAAFLASGIIQP